MKRTKIKAVLNAKEPCETIQIKGWVRTRRSSKKFSFLEINDGSCLKNIQVIADNSLQNYNEITKLSIGSSVEIYGMLVESIGSGQSWEIQSKSIEILNCAPDSYPLQKKRHSDEYLRSIAHLRPRTNKYGAAFRIRSELFHTIHNYYQDKGFIYLNTPIITGSDCEGAGDLFRVTTIESNNETTENGNFDFSKDFFGKETNLTVSGQLSAEMFALAGLE